MNLADFHFLRPFWLLALLPAVVMLVFLLRSKLSQGSWSNVCDPELLPFLLQEKALSQSRWPIFTGMLATLLVIIALAGPTWQRIPSPVFRNDSAVVIALDLSRSMDAEDIKPSRLTRARYKIADILKKRKDGQTALLVYAGDAFTVTPLTDDTNTIDSQLTALTTDIMPSQGSNTELVLKRAVEMFKRAGLQKGQILLVTDGVNADDTRSAIKSLDKYQLTILGVGTNDGAPIPVMEGGFLKDSQGNIVIAKLDDANLAKLAQLGHGTYQTITPDDSDVENILAKFDDSVKQQGLENNNLLLDQWDEKGPWLLLAVLPLAALMFRRGLLCIGLILLLPLPKNSYAFEWQDLWQTQNQQAQQAFQKQDYKKAAEQFQTPNWQAAALYKAGEYEQALQKLTETDDPNAAYNKGNALAQSGQLQEAIAAYDEALKLDPNNTDAKYNKELVEKELEKQKKQPKDNKNADQKNQSQKDKQKEEKGDNSGESGNDQSQPNPESSENKPDSEQQKGSEKQNQDKVDQAAEKQQAKQEQEKQAQEAEQQQKAEQEKQPDSQKKPEAAKQAAESLKPTDEEKQANEQWLKRIPDDPAGLLKRKFEYQYKYEYQRKQNHQPKTDEAW